ncbi:hypothetical protein DLE60_17390 [Micromonospora globispora]|uniref:RHS repeat protein n=1 Tax=Micromonospora globispora TaxID=1450148 RepID=UPI000D6F86BD|nr:RHS repeat protein [Micromonospora globispora]PWU59247.1 hypothetical protein DLE60_17390 [Micromonospora globispora]
MRRDRFDTMRDAGTGAVTGRQAFAEEYVYDELDRVVERRDSLGNTTRHGYDSRDAEVVTIDPVGRATRVEFDLFGRPAIIREEPGPGDADPARETRLEHDRNGNLVAVVDARGRWTSYRYDALDRLVQTTRADGRTECQEFDRAARLVARTDANGLRVRYTLDAAGRTTQVDVDRSGLPAGLVVEGADTSRHEFDSLNRPTREVNDFVDRRVQHDSLGWPVRETVTISRPVPLDDLILEREFDALGDVVEVGYPGGRRVRLERDPLGQVTRITNVALGQGYPGSATPPDPIAVFGYAGARIVTIAGGNGVTATFHHDGAGRPVDLRYSAGAPLLGVQYLYDAAGQVSLRQDAADAAERFLNDQSGWLLRVAPENPVRFDPTPLAPPTDVLPSPLPDRQADIDALAGPFPAGAPALTFAYDAAGNRSREVSGSVIDYEVDDVDEYVERAGVVLTYDANGNLRGDGERDYVYDADNRLVRVTDRDSGTDLARFFHDGGGRRAVEVVDGHVTLCLPEISSEQVRQPVCTRAGCRRDDRVGGCRGGRVGPGP